MWGFLGLQQGGVVVTDMDHIERSNLNRQLLFRQQHIGQSKSSVAAQQVSLINPLIGGRVVGLSHKLGAQTEGLFDASFWGGCHVVATALDNVDARLYVDEMCLKFGRWMVDSGTLGTKGNTQVVVPFVSESYSSQSDPPEDAIPLCTLKSFPYQPEHCVAWAKSKLEQFLTIDVALLAPLRDMLKGQERGGE
ncbi:hypothetical protein B484DRAFT_426327, partial [Ochromonadaceae sp. CCMP2298]